MRVQALGWTVWRCVVLRTIPTYRGCSRFTENLAAGTGAYTITDGINMWKNEAKDYNPKNPQPSHFTQVVWKSTTRVGCAFTTCAPGTIFPKNYGVR